MKFLLRLILLLIITLAGLYTARTLLWGGGKAYPVTLELTNLAGQTKTLTVHGRTGHNITVSAVGMPGLMDYSLSELNLISRMRVYLFPQGQEATSSKTVVDDSVDLKAVHLAETKKRLEALRKQHSHLKLKIRAAQLDEDHTKNGILGRLLGEEKLLVRDINELVVKIHEHENF